MFWHSNRLEVFLLYYFLLSTQCIKNNICSTQHPVICFNILCMINFNVSHLSQNQKYSFATTLNCILIFMLLLGNNSLKWTLSYIEKCSIADVQNYNLFLFLFFRFLLKSEMYVWVSERGSKMAELYTQEQDTNLLWTAANSFWFFFLYVQDNFKASIYLSFPSLPYFHRSRLSHLKASNHLGFSLHLYFRVSVTRPSQGTESSSFLHFSTLLYFLKSGFISGFSPVQTLGSLVQSQSREWPIT